MIIRNLLDQDMYKFTMMQAALHNFPSAMVEWKFVNRGPQKLGFLKANVQAEIEDFCNISFSKEHIDILKAKMPYLSEDYLDFLKFFKLDYSHVTVKEVDGDLDIRIKGSWYQTMLFEVPVLAIISELWTMSQNVTRMEVNETFYQRLMDKIKYLNENAPDNFRFADFGTRRRASYKTQSIEVEHLRYYAPQYFVGTSNVWLAHVFDTKAIGTHAHEWFMAMQAMFRLADSQKMGLEIWAKEFRGELGIALTDTIGLDAFLRDFDKYFSKLYDGGRHDSGDPYVFGEKFINHYNGMKIDPLTKTIVYSNELTFPKAIDLTKKFSDRIGVSHGIGTYLSNDTCVDPLKIVMKLVSCNDKPVAKISDSVGKTICENEGYVNYLKSQFVK